MSNSSSQSWAPEESQVSDPFVAVFTSPSRSRSIIQRPTNDASPHSLNAPAASGEREPLLDGGTPRAKKPFYRARPLWLVPFAVTAALVRGMTLAPRIEVFTQLSCSRLHHSYNHTAATWVEATSVMPAYAPLYFGLDPLGPQFNPVPNQALPLLGLQEDEPWDDDDTGVDDPRQLPSPRCLSDPAVQAGAARIQTMFTTTMGFLSALTTGWWGRFGERHGRTKVLAFSVFGLFLTDLIFILASTPSSPLSSHGHKLLLIAPVIEGLLGGWSTLQSATSAYISDCTSSGSRASVFSRFTGVSFLGFGLGPIIGGWLIRHPIAFFTGQPHPGQPQAQTVTSAFWVAIGLQFINLCLVLFVFPESTTQEQRDLASGKGKGKSPDRTSGNGTLEDVVEESTDESPAGRGIIRDFLSPLAIFLPVPIFVDGSMRKRKDWSLTFLACGMFGYMLSTGLSQIKYLYAGHVYGWGPEQLSYYISFLGTTRAMFLMFALPFIISAFKPKSKVPKGPAGTNKAAKPKPTKAHIAREIKFDLGLSRLSLCIDIVANLSIVFAPAPMYKMHLQAINDLDSTLAVSSEFQNSQALFVVASWMQCLGAGVVPAMQSLALCIIQARSLLAADAGQAAKVDAATGTLFGALAVLQAGGQMVLGPLLFGLVYSGTVATFPKTIFVTAIAILFASLTAIMLVRSPLSEVNGKSAVRRRRLINSLEEEQRGRSRNVHNYPTQLDLNLHSTATQTGAGSLDPIFPSAQTIISKIEDKYNGNEGTSFQLDPTKLSTSSIKPVVMMDNTDGRRDPGPWSPGESLQCLLQDAGGKQDVRKMFLLQIDPPLQPSVPTVQHSAHWKEHKPICKECVTIQAQLAEQREAAPLAGKRFCTSMTIQTW
ncbi:major facilitator superfamily domain-containing protein [Mycena capillaripes]|nr:major facilitator superfamily domain-containing protein [Mycena capillaripes]